MSSHINKFDKLWWYEYTRPEIEEFVKECDIALLPIGSIEQHGDHLPCGEDSYHAIKIAEEVARKTKVMLLPCPWYGAHPYSHYNQFGTIPIGNETYKEFLKDIVRGAGITGFNKFIILNCHGQAWILPWVAQELGLEGYFIIGPTLWDITKDLINEVMETEFMHAEETETSLGLYLVPELVDMTKAYDDGYGEHRGLDRKWFTSPSKIMTHHVNGSACATRPPLVPGKLRTAHGVHGYPTKGTAEKGKKVVDAAVAWLVELIEEIKSKYPPGVNPCKPS